MAGAIKAIINLNSSRLLPALPCIRHFNNNKYPRGPREVFGWYIPKNVRSEYWVYLSLMGIELDSTIVVKPIYKTEAQLAREEEMGKLIRIDTPEDVSLVTGVPEEHTKDRKVLIKLPTKNSMQSGSNNLHKWTMSFDNQTRWENPLMGWCSNADPLSNMEIEFGTKDEAAAFCEKNGWAYEFQTPPQKTPRAKSYAANFSWNKRTRRSAK